MNNVKKQRKTIEWERVEISSIRSEMPGKFHAEVDTVMNRNAGMDITEAEDIKKRWQRYTEEVYRKKILMTWITTVV